MDVLHHDGAGAAPVTLPKFHTELTGHGSEEESVINIDQIVRPGTAGALLDVFDSNGSSVCTVALPKFCTERCASGCEVKHIVDLLKQRNRPEISSHRKIYRPWGWYDSIDTGERFQVKRIVVNPGAALSLQMHHHRAEHWIVVRGTARVTKAEETFLVSENESTYIPLGTPHRLENPGRVPLEMIEVQSGSYLGEDDIVRFEDKYGRKEN